MESMGKKKPRPRRSFTPEFKAEIVELCRRGDRSVGQVAKDFDLTETAVRDWVKQAEVDAGGGIVKNCGWGLVLAICSISACQRYGSVSMSLPGVGTGVGPGS